MEFRRKRALESPPGLLSLLESDHNRAKRPFLDLSEPRRIFRRFSSAGKSLFASVKKKRIKKAAPEQSWGEARQIPHGDQGMASRGIEGISWRKNILFPSRIKSSTLQISSSTSPSPSPLQSPGQSSASPFTSSFDLPLSSSLTSREQEENVRALPLESSEGYPSNEDSEITRPKKVWALSRPSSLRAMPLTLSRMYLSSMQTEKKPSMLLSSSSSLIMPLSDSKMPSPAPIERGPSSFVTPLPMPKMHISIPPQKESSMPLTVSRIHLSAQTNTTTPSSASVTTLIGSKMPPETHNSTQSQEVPAWKKLLNEARARDRTIGGIQSEIRLNESLLKSRQETRVALELEKLTITKPPEEKKTAAFECLTEEEEEEVHQALNGANRNQVLVQHERSNIDLTRATLQCLRPGAWLNDDVINLYLELLKERELREPETSMKCHFFNTFFYNKLYKDAHSYDYKSVRRWTTLKKLGYSLLECDKIFVPIHQDIHWCLAVINMQEKKIQYLDSLGGHDENVLHVLARYLKDEAKDKLNQDFDPNNWKLDCPKDIPVQLNGCDCGMFMIKYADFYSHGNDLKFSQEDMEYFRKRTVIELLQLKAR